MTLRAVLLLLISVGWWRLPAASHPGGRFVGRAAALVAAVMVTLAFVASPVIDMLEIDAETFRIAAGLVLIVSGSIRLLGVGARVEEYSGRLGWVAPLAYPVLMGPETVLAAVSVGADHGVVLVLVVALMAAVMTLMAMRVSVRPVIAGLWVRAGGAALVLLSVALVFDGLRDI